MMVRSTTVDSAGNTRAELPVLAILFIGCMIFSSVLHALPAAETSALPAVINDVQMDVQVDVVAEHEAILKGNTKCLKCHSREKFKLLEDGEQMSVQLQPEVFTGSVHGGISCVSCHQAIGNRKHPSKETNITINSQREYSVELNKNCRSCHVKTYAEYEGSVHAAMVAQGSTEAPVCTGCHSAHAVETMAEYRPETGLPCKNCHELIFNAYSESVHGEARLHENVIRDRHIQASICADCHGSHDANAVAIGDTLRSACFDCHENVTLLHSQWLPNTGTHLDIVSCAVCHAPFAKHRYDLHLYDNIAQAPVGQEGGHEAYQQQLQEIEAAGGDVDPLELWRAVGNRGPQGQLAGISLRSRMEVISGIAAHQIAPKSFAVRTCDSCHEPGSRQAKGVTISVPQSDGRIQSYEADRDALNTAISVDSTGISVDSISDFYAIGGHKNKLLDILLLIAIFMGIAIPVGHFTLGKMIKEKIERGEP